MIYFEELFFDKFIIFQDKKTCKCISEIVEALVFSESLFCVPERFSRREKTLAETEVVDDFISEAKNLALERIYRQKIASDWSYWH